MNKEDATRELVRLRLEQAEAALHDTKLLIEAQSVQGAINRSYYAMFYATLALLQSVGMTPRKHTGVLSLFDREFVAKGMFPKQLSWDFHEAFGLRQDSDYRFLRPLGVEKAALVCEKATRFVHAIVEYLQPSLPPTP